MKENVKKNVLENVCRDRQRQTNDEQLGKGKGRESAPGACM